MGAALAGALGDTEDCGAEPPHAVSRTTTANVIALMYRVTANWWNGYAATLVR